MTFCLSVVCISSALYIPWFFPWYFNAKFKFPDFSWIFTAGNYFRNLPWLPWFSPEVGTMQEWQWAYILQNIKKGGNGNLTGPHIPHSPIDQSCESVNILILNYVLAQQVVSMKVKDNTRGRKSADGVCISWLYVSLYCFCSACSYHHPFTTRGTCAVSICGIQKPTG